MTKLVDLTRIVTARQTLESKVLTTPVLQCPEPMAQTCELWIKAESLQRTGSFKFRGAYNAASRAIEQSGTNGVVTYSSGNHGKALAYAAHMLGVPSLIVMPNDANPAKVQAIRKLGADVLFVVPAERQAIAERLSRERGLTLVPPYDHPDVIAGQGTIGLEIHDQLPDVQAVLVPVGGGALASGVATTIKALNPRVKVFGVEPELAADASAGLAAGARTSWSMELTGRTIADGLRTNLSDLTFAHLQRYLDDILLVSEADIIDAVSWLCRQHLIVEPSGAVGIAAARRYTDRFAGQKIVAIASGGNIDPALLENIATKWLANLTT
jgi:threonine dehydratase